MAVEYSFTVRWGSQSCTVTSFTSFQEAEKSAWEFARKCGYTEPRWWEFWRLSDSRPA